MNPKPIFKLFSLKGIRPTVISQQVSTLVISLAVSLLFALTVYAQDPTSDRVITWSRPAVRPKGPG